MINIKLFLIMSLVLVESFSEFLQVVSEVAASVEELSNTFVKEGFEEFGRGSKACRKDKLMEVVEMRNTKKTL